MEKIGFIGAYDKSNFIIYLSKVLQLLGKKVLVVDTTKIQKMKYLIPTIDPTKSYITSFEEIDFAIGFSSWLEIERYLGTAFETNDMDEINEKNVTQRMDKKPLFDYVLLDIDSKEMLESFDITGKEKNYLVTGFDSYSLKRGFRIFEHLKTPMELTRIFFSYETQKEDEEYFNYLSMEYKLNFTNYIMYFPIQGIDNQVFEENQRLEKIQFRRLSMKYKESLIYMVQDIEKKSSVPAIRKAMKD